jgi:4-hydroxybenzoate polyprenyltransferase
MISSNSPLGRLVKYLELIRFSHTVFALPFALVSTFLALKGSGISFISQQCAEKLIWIILAMVGARSGAMGFNRFVDRKYDIENPRTSTRPSVTGEIAPVSMVLLIVFSYGLLILAAWQLNDLAFKLSPVAIILVSFYSFTKRFTFLSHLFLGIAIGVAPVAGWIAVTGEISLTSLVLGLSVLTWIAGFDILYALQDLDYDKQAGLHSIPVTFGISGSLVLSRCMHLISVACWLFVFHYQGLGWIFLGGIILSLSLLFWEHRLIKKDDLSKLDIAFFNTNAVISVTLLVALIFDIIVFN